MNFDCNSSASKNFSRNPYHFYSIPPLVTKLCRLCIGTCYDWDYIFFLETLAATVFSRFPSLLTLPLYLSQIYCLLQPSNFNGTSRLSHGAVVRHRKDYKQDIADFHRQSTALPHAVHNYYRLTRERWKASRMHPRNFSLVFLICIEQENELVQAFVNVELVNILSV